MPCHNCCCEFGILKREVGCNICGFSFCKKCCCKRQVTEENSELQNKHICMKCFESMSNSKASKMGSISPPLAHKKRMAMLKKQSYSMDCSSSQSSQWDNEKDREISERLQRLKKDRQKAILPSEMEIEERLAKLKGMDPAKYKAPPVMVYRPSDRRSSCERADDLMGQMKKEVDLDSRLVKPEDEIAARLARLRDQEVPVKPEVETMVPCTVGHSSASEEMDVESELSDFQKKHISSESEALQEIKNLNKSDDLQNLLIKLRSEKEKEGADPKKNTDDDEEEANKLIEKLMATNMHEDEMGDLDSLNNGGADDSEKKSIEDEEFPWCVICNEDAKMRCFDCDSDLYCITCFKECHDNFDIQGHKTCPYFPPKDPLA